MARINMDRFKAASEKLKQNMKKPISTAVPELKETTVENKKEMNISRKFWVL